MAGPRIIRGFAAAYDQPFFVEVGSNDGEQHDHLHHVIREGEWRGLMVEPVPYVFERLRRNYAEAPHVALENAAIADRDGVLPFFHLAEADAEDSVTLPAWYDALGSFSREIVARHQAEIPDIESRIVETRVPCLTFDSLCARHRVDNVDLLLIDTEGYDYEVIKGVDFSRWRPRLLIYEHYHLGRADAAACRAELEQAGYSVMSEGLDTFCVLEGPEDELAKAWRGLRPAIPPAFAEGTG